MEGEDCDCNREKPGFKHFLISKVSYLLQPNFSTTIALKNIRFLFTQLQAPTQPRW
jgi:hypothetical protein